MSNLSSEDDEMQDSDNELLSGGEGESLLGLDDLMLASQTSCVKIAYRQHY